MRLLIVGINFYPELTGIGKYTGEAAAYLSERGHEVRVVAAPPYYPHWRVQAPYREWRYKRECWRGIRLYRCPLWVPRRPSGVGRLFHLASFALSSSPVLLMQIFWRPQLILAVAPALSVAPFALLAARLSGAKAWLHIQDFEIDAALGLGLLPAKGKVASFLWRLESHLLRAFDIVSTISQRMGDRLRAKSVPENKIVFSPNWVDTEAIYPLDESSNALRVEMGFSSADLVVLYSGNMGKKQGLEIAIEAASLLRSVNGLYFVLCGEGAGRAEMQKRAADLTNVRFLPLQPVERLNLLLNLADIHILPQRGDVTDLVMPSKITGMLASGKPIVATAHADTELASIIRESGILVPPDDPQALASGIMRLATSAAERRKLGEHGRKFACQFLDRKVLLERLAKELEALPSYAEASGET